MVQRVLPGFYPLVARIVEGLTTAAHKFVKKKLGFFHLTRHMT
jgi:hypothetical protein